MRWNATATLVHHVRKQASDGSHPITSSESSIVFCNRNTIGLSTLIGRTETSIKPDAAIQVRTSDYSGQECVQLDGVEYSVEGVSERGEFTSLALGRMGRNV